MATRAALVGAGGAALVVAIAGVLIVSLGDDAEALRVTHEWVEARNDGDIETVFRLLAGDASVIDFSLNTPDRRDAFAELLRVQQAAEWKISDSNCVVDQEVVTCRYEQSDVFLRALDVSLAGTHRYVVHEGVITSVEREHDTGSRDEVFDAWNRVQLWVGEHHPDLEAVIWVNRRDIAYSTVEGVEALLTVFDDYLASLPTISG